VENPTRDRLAAPPTTPVAPGTVVVMDKQKGVRA
jgi:hypothetical protein